MDTGTGSLQGLGCGKWPWSRSRIEGSVQLRPVLRVQLALAVRTAVTRLTLHNHSQISPDYRTIPESDGPSIAADVASAYDFVTSGGLNKAAGAEEVDGSRGVVCAISAGGWSSTLLCAKTDNKPKALIDVYGTWSLVAAPWHLPAENPIEMPGGILEQLAPLFEGLVAAAKAGQSKPTKGAYLNLFELGGQPPEAFLQLAAANGISAEEVKAFGFDRLMTQEEKVRNLLCPWSVNAGKLDVMGEGPDGKEKGWKEYPKDPSVLFDAKFPPTLLIHGE